MNWSSNSEVRRCRPLLGTFVEITAAGLAEASLQEAVTAAFAGMEEIQRRLSVHDPASELSLLNREAARRTISVSQETHQILHRADRLAIESNGAFDYTVAPMLADWGMLPAALRRENAGGWRDVMLLRRRQVRFLRPLALDLGGLAKGHAVDRAVEILYAHGVAAATVNAGGDLRVFGAKPATIHLRHPSGPQAFAQTIQLNQTAFATSSPCFTENHFNGLRVSHLVDSIRRTAITGTVSVSVRARECWLADALTKVVFNAPRLAQKLLAKHRAEAFVLTA